MANEKPAKLPSEKLKYPKSVFFIISNEFCERFSYYGMRTILALYLVSLGYSEKDATLIYHLFVMLCYFTPVFGGILADSYWGKFNTIFYVSLVYTLGNIVLSLGSITSLGINHIAASMVGLFLIGAGTGGIKPCVSSFGGDQFVLPQQENQLQKFFSVFYFSINAGSLISCFISPILREKVQCFGEDTCYPLAFGIPAVLMCLSIIFFVCGKPFYKNVPPTKGNIAFDIVKCCWHAISRKIRIQKVERKEHWLDYADDTFSLKLIEETKIVLKLIYLFAPTIVFWALFEQQGSRWTFQANHMDGDLGFYIIEPDQMQTINSVLILVLIPIFESFIYPLLAKCRIVRTPLQKLSYGGILAGVAFLISGIIQLKIEAEEPVLPSNGVSYLRLYNTLNCPLTLSSNDLGITDFQLNALDTTVFDNIKVDFSKTVELKTKFSGECGSAEESYKINLMNETISNYLFTKVSSSNSLLELQPTNGDAIAKSIDGNTKIKVLYGGPESLELMLVSSIDRFNLNYSNHQSKPIEVKSYLHYDLIINGVKCNKKFFLRPGGVFTLMITNVSSPEATLLVITEPNKMNLLWQIPQYVVITVAEIMFSITGIEFSFTQSPLSMKSVVSSLWLLTDSFGNLIILIIAGIQIFDHQSSEFFLFAGLMTFVMIIFIMIARTYKYVEFDTEKDTAPQITQE